MRRHLRQVIAAMFVLSILVAPLASQPQNGSAAPTNAPAATSAASLALDDNIAGMWHIDIGPGAQLDRLASSGGKWVRVFVLWDRVEALNQSPPKYDWSFYDQQFTLLATRGLRSVVTVSNAPEWAAFPICGPYKPGMQSRFVDFMKALVARYGSAPYNVKFWQLYNEEDFNMQDPTDKYGGNPDRSCWGQYAIEYANMLKAVYPAVKQVDPEARIAIGPLTADNCVWGNNCNFLRELVDPAKGNAGDYFDYVSFNYYYWFRRNWEMFGPSVIGKAQGHRATLAEFGKSKPVIVSELGVRVDGEFGRTDDDAARYAPMALTQALNDHFRPTHDGIDIVIWFSLVDNPDGRWGLIDDSGTPRPGYNAYQRWTTEMATAKPLSNKSEKTFGSNPNAIPCVGTTLFCGALQWYQFGVYNGSIERSVIWVDPGAADKHNSTSITRTVELPLNRVMDVRDKFGKTLTYVTKGDVAVLSVGDSPVYVDLKPPSQSNLDQNGGQVTVPVDEKKPDAPKLNIVFPTGAFSQSITVTVSLVDAPPGSNGLAAVGKSFVLNVGDNTAEFQKPVTVTLELSAVDLVGINAQSLAVYWLNPVTGQWERLNSFLSAALMATGQMPTISALTTKPGQFAVLGQQWHFAAPMVFVGASRP